MAGSFTFRLQMYPKPVNRKEETEHDFMRIITTWEIGVIWEMDFDLVPQKTGLNHH